MVSYAIRINDILSGLFYGIWFKLVDFKIEFGRLFRQSEQGDEMRLVLADEISPDSCRLWDLDTNESFAKDRFRLDKGHVAEGYQEVARRLGVLKASQASKGEKVLTFVPKDKS